jgi:hypothetical protein
MMHQPKDGTTLLGLLSHIASGALLTQDHNNDAQLNWWRKVKDI